MIELIQPVVVQDDGAENTLLVTVKDKGHQTADSDTKLEALASAEPGTHDECRRYSVRRAKLEI
jgi:hypothetical protein